MGFVPSKDLPESLASFKYKGWDETQINKTLKAAKHKVGELKEFCDVTKSDNHVAAVLAYTEETELYSDLNLTMRTKGGMYDKKLKAYGEYIYHLSESIGTCANYIGKALFPRQSKSCSFESCNVAGVQRHWCVVA